MCGGIWPSSFLKILAVGQNLQGTLAAGTLPAELQEFRHDILTQPLSEKKLGKRVGGLLQAKTEKYLQGIPTHIWELNPGLTD